MQWHNVCVPRRSDFPGKKLVAARSICSWGSPPGPSLIVGGNVPFVLDTVSGKNNTNEERHMDQNTKTDTEARSWRRPLNAPPVVSAEEWEDARQRLLVKEKAVTRARDALAAERRRMPWLA